jgi:3-dehydroquinate synthetase
LLSKFDLPSVNIQDYDKFMTYIKNDKKIRASNIKFILLDEIGKSQINNNISFEQIKESLKVL